MTTRKLAAVAHNFPRRLLESFVPKAVSHNSSLSALECHNVKASNEPQWLVASTRAFTETGRTCCIGTAEKSGDSISVPQDEEIKVTDYGDPVPGCWGSGNCSRHSISSSTLISGSKHSLVLLRFHSGLPVREGGRWMRIAVAYAEPLASTFHRNPFREGSIRFISNKKMKKKKAKRREELYKINKIHVPAKKRKDLMTAEELLEYKIKKETKKIELIKAAIGEFPKQEIPPASPDRHFLTVEQAHYYKRMGYKSRNYVPVGRRGIYGGTIQNIHLHWKKHETVQVEIVGFSKNEVRVMADHLERLSGGKLIDISPKDIVLLWRGKNYEQPKVLVPMKTLDKRKALQKSKLEQSQQTHTDNLVRSEKELCILQKESAQKQTQLLPADARVQQESKNSVHEQVRTSTASGEDPRQYSRYSGYQQGRITENHQELPLMVGDKYLLEEWSSHQESIFTGGTGRVGSTFE